MKDGWKCPKCDRILAPHVEQCAHKDVKTAERPTEVVYVASDSAPHPIDPWTNWCNR